MAASDILSNTEASSASQRLGSGGKPTGKAGSPVLTVKLRNQFAEESDGTVQFEEWLAAKGYAIGDNDHVYKK